MSFWQERHPDLHNRSTRHANRRKRGRGYLIPLEAEAEKRGLTLHQMKDKILRTVVEEDLLTAVLDD